MELVILTVIITFVIGFSLAYLGSTLFNKIELWYLRKRIKKLEKVVEEIIKQKQNKSDKNV